MALLGGNGAGKSTLIGLLSGRLGQARWAGAPPRAVEVPQDPDLSLFCGTVTEELAYGARAREALQHAGLWPALQGRLVMGENISQATQFALSGSTQGGIVAQSLALAPSVASRGSFALIPEAWHQPLLQRMALMKNAPPAAQAFYAHLSSPAAQAVLERYGFAVPR